MRGQSGVPNERFGRRQQHPSTHTANIRDVFQDAGAHEGECEVGGAGKMAADFDLARAVHCSNELQIAARFQHETQSALQ